MRVRGWEVNLDEAIQTFEGVAFEWGRTDCVHFAAAVVGAVTGRDVTPAGMDYIDGAGAVEALRQYGGGGMFEACERFAGEQGWEKVSADRAQRGDLVVLDDVDGSPPFVAVIDGTGRRAASMQEDGGLVRFPACEVEAAWRVV